MRNVTLLLLGASACGIPDAKSEVGTPARQVVKAKQQVVKAIEIDARYVEAIRTATPAYLAWGRVDERPRAAPTNCSMPGGNPGGEASHVRISEATNSPHDKKLYYLWASDRSSYLGQSQHDQPLPNGFTIVKESFHADRSVATANAAPHEADYHRAPPPIRTLRVGDRWLETGTATGLYVMTKIGGRDAPGTDEGWIYGTIATDGTVTSAGRVASCMGCHESATHERLFGLKPIAGHGE